MTKLRSLIFAALLALPFTSSFAQVEFSVGWAPPPLPVVEQPPCPVAGYIWTPGYWGWDDYYYDYYWVPGVWVAPPRVGLLWTPGWWGWNNGAYVFNQGYWGPTVGFYGGINYGYGYTGNGYWGGRWNGNTFQYNTAVTRVDTNIVHNTYVNNSFTRNVNATRTSFNGGNGGITAQPNAEQKKAMANKVGLTSQQLNRQQAASKDQNLRASVNKGKPNQEAIKSFNKTEAVGKGKGAQEIGAAGAGAGTKPGNLTERNVNKAGAGKGENKPGNANERNLQRTEAGNTRGNANKLNAGNQGNIGNTGGNQTKMHTGKGVAGSKTTLGPKGRDNVQGMNQHAMNQQKLHQSQMGAQRNPQIGPRNPQMAGKHPQMQGGGNRPHPNGGQQQGKKKQGKH